MSFCNFSSKKKECFFIIDLDQPNIEPRPALPIAEGNDLSLSCIANLDGLNGNQVTYKWTKIGAGNEVLSESSVYNLTNITRTAAGSYQCSVSSSGIVRTKNISVIVHCKYVQHNVAAKISYCEA